MSVSSALPHLEQEARALLTRLERVRAFALQETMVPAAMPSYEAQNAIEHYLAQGRRRLHHLVSNYIRWLHTDEAQRVSAAETQQRFSLLRLRFNAVLTQFDIYADAISQRSERVTGIWLAGLDSFAADALTLPGDYYLTPAVICYLDRGHGAAIRRARTRLPGGGENPVAVIRVPRERMIGSGIASSLVHEVGHQGAALIDLVTSLRPLLRGMQQGDQGQRLVWRCWERWISEIVADFWSVAQVGIASTHGLIGVVSLPRFFIFRFTLDDPHPFPWIRVKLSCAMGRALYPDPQWDTLERLWESFYPRAGLSPKKLSLLQLLDAGIPSFVSLLVHHRPSSLKGKTLSEIFAPDQKQPARLRALFNHWQRSPGLERRAAPTLVFAVLGQAKADGKLSPKEEGQLLDELLTHWALTNTLQRSAECETGTTSICLERRKQWQKLT